MCTESVYKCQKIPKSHIFYKTKPHNKYYWLKMQTIMKISQKIISNLNNTIT